MTFGQINVGTGELEVYYDDTKGITPELVEEAQEKEAQIIEGVNVAEQVYYRIGEMLKDFRDRELYRARNFNTFNEWADSPELARIGRQTANNLIRIVEGLEPIFERHGLDLGDYPMSVARAMLPLLNDNKTEEEIVDIAERVKDLTVRDASAIIKESRGLGDRDEPTIFKAFVQIDYTERVHMATIVAVRPDGVSFDMGKLMVDKRDYPRFQQFYGRWLEEV